MRQAIIFGALLCLWAGQAQAYILPADELLHLWAESRRGTTWRDVTLVLEADITGRDHPVDERLYLKRPERARLTQQDDTTYVVVDKEGARAAGEDRDIKPLPNPGANVWVSLLAPRGRDIDDCAARMLKVLQSVGIDIAVVSLSRINQMPAYVIGARPWEGTKPQVWLDKNTFAPVRAIALGGPARTTLIDVRLAGYGQGAGGSLLPRTFEEYEDNKLLRRAEVTGATFNQDLPETLFEWTHRR